MSRERPWYMAHMFHDEEMVQTFALQLVRPGDPHFYVLSLSAHYFQNRENAKLMTHQAMIRCHREIGGPRPEKLRRRCSLSWIDVPPYRQTLDKRIAEFAELGIPHLELPDGILGLYDAIGYDYRTKTYFM